MLGESKNVGSGSFLKRELVVTTDEQYPQHILVEFVQDKCDLLNNYQVGDAVKVSINLRGREWVDPQGVTKYFNAIQGWRVEKLGAAAPAQAAPAQSASIPFLIGGGGGSPSKPGPGPNPVPPTRCTKRDEKITFEITSREWQPSPTTNGSPCRCQKEGKYVIKGRIYNPNCIGKNVTINGTITITDKNGRLTKYEGSTTVGVNGSNGEPIPKEPPSLFDQNKPTPSPISLSTLPMNPNVKGFSTTNTNLSQSIPGFNKNNVQPAVQNLNPASKPSVQGLNPASKTSVQNLNPASKNVAQGMNLSNSKVGKGAGVQGLKTTLF